MAVVHMVQERLRYVALVGHSSTELLFQGGGGSRQPSALELSVATTQGKTFYELLSRLKF